MILTLPIPLTSPYLPQSLAKIFEIVNEPLRESMPDAEFLFGRKELKEQGSPPRVVWVPTHDSYAARNSQAGNPPAVATCHAGVEAHIWGPDMETTEGMRNAVVYVLLKKLLGSLLNGTSGFSGRWLTQEEDVAGLTRLGEVYVLHFAVAVPVLAPGYPLAKVRQLNTETTGTAGDGVLECGEE